jgi:hypothetical protein
MQFKSILKPQDSVISGVAVAALVAAIWSKSLPDSATLHATQAYDNNVEAGRKKANWTSAFVVSLVTLLTRDVNIFILGGLVDIAFDIHARHALITHPDTGQVVTNTWSQQGLKSVA